MAIMSIDEARKYLKKSDITDGQIKELLELMDELIWCLIGRDN